MNKFVEIFNDILNFREFWYVGFRPKPRLTFCLDTKSKQKLNKLKALRSAISKQVLYCFHLNVLFKTSPASLEKSTFGRLKSSKLVEVRPIDCNFKSAHYELQLQTRTIFNRLPLLFFGSPAEVVRLRAASLCVSLLFHLKWKNQRFAENINTNEQYSISL